MSLSDDTTLDLEIRESGSGPPLLFLHGWAGTDGTDVLLERLASDFTVLAPAHPGFDGSPRPPWVTTVDDLAYVYLDLLAQRDLRDVAVLGVSLGGWIAAEMAVRSTERLSGLVLANPIGIRVGGFEDRDAADIYALSREQVHALVYHDAEKIPLNVDGRDEQELMRLARNEETAALLLWKPYMHNPKLRRRLSRIAVPTLVAWGESDGIVDTDYGRAFAEAIPGSRLELIEGAGHAPDVEQPDRLAELTAGFLGRTREVTA
jgi:pimeloyl-ACP methyl ester carboxylesterase